MKWSESEVSQWLDWTVQEFGFNPVKKSNWQLSGLQLCALSKEEFLERAPPYTGDVLHSHLNLLKAKGIHVHVIIIILYTYVTHVMLCIEQSIPLFMH